MAKPPVAERTYETLLICPPETNQKSLDTLSEKIKGLIDAEKGNLKSFQVWGRRRLSYPIKRHKDGIYIYVDFDSNRNVISKLDNLFSVSDLVIRHMTVIKEEAPVPTVKPTATKSEEPAKQKASPETPAAAS